MIEKEGHSHRRTVRLAGRGCRQTFLSHLFTYLLAQIKIHTVISTDTNNMEIVLI